MTENFFTENGIGGEYAPILDVLFNFVMKILEYYLPTEIKDVITDIENLE